MIYFLSNDKYIQGYNVVKEFKNGAGYILSKGTKVNEPEHFVDKYPTLFSLISAATFFTAIPAFMIYDKVNKKKAIKESIKQDQNLDIMRVSPEYFFEHKEQIEAFALQLIKYEREFQIIIDDNAEDRELSRDGSDAIEYNYSGKQIAELLEFNNKLRSQGMKNSIRFNEFHETQAYDDLSKSFSLEQVIDANKQIDDIVDTIKRNNFSPYEAMVYIHKFLTTNFGFDKKVYEQDEFDKDYNKYNSIVGALLSKKTICVGYASLTKAIIDKLNMPGLSCKFQKVQYAYNDGSIQGYDCHVLNLINIDDAKYDIKGTFVDDAEPDCKDEKFPSGKGYANFMYPLIDLENSKSHSTLTPTMHGSRSWSIHNDIDWGAWSKLEGSTNAVPFEKTKQAISHVYSKIDEFHKDKTPEEAAQIDIENSMAISYQTLRTWAENPFLKEMKKVKFEELKNGNYRYTFSSGNTVELDR